MVRKIEIDFALPVELTDNEMRQLCDLTQEIAKRHQPEGWYHWQFGCGSKPRFSQTDAIFLGKTAEPDAPMDGEPTFDDEIFHIETSAREASPEELKRDAERESRRVAGKAEAK